MATESDPDRSKERVGGRFQFGLIGFGAIARALVAEWPEAEARWVAMTRTGEVRGLPPHVATVPDVEALIRSRPDAVVEAAGQEGTVAFVPQLLEAGIPVVIASVGVMSDPIAAERLINAARRGNTKLLTSGGALGGLDYLRAVATLPDVRVQYTSRKPMAAWTKELSALGYSQSEGPVTLFEGAPADAARRFPQNLNAAYTIALAVGADKVDVRVIADPTATENTHEIHAESSAGTAFFRFVNAPAPSNPKTSTLTALSLNAVLRELLAEMGPR